MRAKRAEAFPRFSSPFHPPEEKGWTPSSGQSFNNMGQYSNPRINTPQTLPEGPSHHQTCCREESGQSPATAFGTLVFIADSSFPHPSSDACCCWHIRQVHHHFFSNSSVSRIRRVHEVPYPISWLSPLHRLRL